MQHASKITTISALVKAFGGPKKLAEWAGIGVSGVSNWVERAYIPPGWHYRLHLEAEDRGFTIDPSVFGVEREGRSSPKRRRPPASPEHGRAA